MRNSSVKIEVGRKFDRFLDPVEKGIALKLMKTLASKGKNVP